MRRKKVMPDFRIHLGESADVNYFRLMFHIRRLSGQKKNTPKLIRKKQWRTYQRMEREGKCS